ncbi:MAG: hypothetical protein KGM42_06210 [Hyphomicrobiales bacterium]|nr:hypothetical protein [Hyphomicrobiales bacterium]
MVRIVRMIGFTISSMGVQLASVVGLAALAASFALGFLRAPLYLILAPALGGAGVAAWLFQDATNAGKVVGAQSNFFFVAFVYLLIGAIGYACGALARRWLRAARGQ